MRIGIVGLGYVGWPLAQALAQQGHGVVGVDISSIRLRQLWEEVQDLDIELSPTAAALDYRDCEVVIVCVPTDIDQAKEPDLRPLRAVANSLREHATCARLIINESTVYPGATAEIFGPMIMSHQMLAYSPERIVPGQPKGEMNGGGRTLANTQKIVACHSEHGLELLRQIYGPICGGLFECQDMAVGEMAKLMENCQRDLNIALMNEAQILADRMEIDFSQVLAAAGTKWNFHPYTPGLVGGHCIGVDPYYLAWAGKRLNFHAQVILAGRQVNDRMGVYWARQIAKYRPERILICGYAFKENCGDCRNTRVEDIRQELGSYLGTEVWIYDPLVEERLGKTRNILTQPGSYRGLAADALVLAVPHDQILDDWASIRECLSGASDPKVFDLKNGLKDEQLTVSL